MSVLACGVMPCVHANILYSRVCTQRYCSRRGGVICVTTVAPLLLAPYHQHCCSEYASWVWRIHTYTDTLRSARPPIRGLGRPGGRDSRRDRYVGAAIPR
jgi:hypothetical protein